MLVLAGCATGAPPPTAPPPAPGGSRAAPPALPATASASASAAARFGLQPIPFPPATFVGEVRSLSPPTVLATGDIMSIGFSLGGSSPAECRLSRRELAGNGSILSVADGNRGRFRLRSPSVTEIAIRPPLPALFLTVHRAFGTIKVAAYRRGHDLALVCLQHGPAPPAEFEDVVAALAASLRPAGPPPAPEELWSCDVRIDGGTTGWERTSITAVDGGTTLRTTAALAYQNGDSIDLLEVDLSERSDARGRVASMTSTRTVNGVTDLRTQLTHLAGATYRYDVTFWGGHVDGTFTAADPEGLLGTLAFAGRIKSELLTGRAPGLTTEVYDPFESPETPTTKTYRVEVPGSRKLLVTTSTRQSHELVDENGYVLGGEFELKSGDTLYETCAPERPRR